MYLCIRVGINIIFVIIIIIITSSYILDISGDGAGVTTIIFPPTGPL